MIVGIGTDLVEIRRMRDMMDRHRGLERIFTKNELAHAKDRADVLAGTFAVKEAVSKAFGTGFFGAEPYEIEVLRNEKGAPFVLLDLPDSIACHKLVKRRNLLLLNLPVSTYF